MLANILGIAKRGNKRITNRARIWGFQIGARGIKNKGRLRDFKSERKSLYRDRVYKSRQEILQTGVRITNRCRTTST